MIGRPHHVADDGVDALGLASFCSAPLGLSITSVSEDWVVVAESDHASGFAFQRAPGHPSCLVGRPSWAPPGP